jgi:Asp-tRNA(Asn)/Glu-tRNA(Gln) amidotransferase B subunit
MIGATINRVIKFSRKHYYYKDSPKSFQLTQEDCDAVCHGGEIPILDLKSKKFTGQTVQFEKVFLEENPGSQLKKCIDFNRAGKPLLEIVTKPIFSSAASVVAYLENLKFMLIKKGYISPIGNFKSDVNISLGYQRVELKNIGSIKDCESAIAAEWHRQKNTIVLIPQCRSYDEVLDETVWMRHKESHQQYLLLEEPDIPKIITVNEPVHTSITYHYADDRSAVTSGDHTIGRSVIPVITACIVRNSQNYYYELSELYTRFPELGLELLFTVSLYNAVKKILFSAGTTISSKKLSQIIQEFKFHSVMELSSEKQNSILKLINKDMPYESFTRSLRSIILGTTVCESSKEDYTYKIKVLIQTKLLEQYTEYGSNRTDRAKKFLIGLIKKEIRMVDYLTIVSVIDE